MIKMVNMCPFFLFKQRKEPTGYSLRASTPVDLRIDHEKREVSGSPFFHEQFIRFFSNKTFLKTTISALFPYLISAKKKKSLSIKFKATSTVLSTPVSQLSA